ncbi:MAG: hypothetical protein Q7U47_03890 [Paludibacter sp.]|nr:hypothetical protein [Paludibacter sp.]
MKAENHKHKLFNLLIKNGAFWSFKNVEFKNVSDVDLVANALLYLNQNEIELLIKSYSKSFLKKVWLEKVIIQDPYFHKRNVESAKKLFAIKNPERYITLRINKYYRQLAQ